MVSAVSKKTAMIVYSNLVPSRALYPAEEKVSGHDVRSTVPNFTMKEIGPRGGASPYKTLLRSTPRVPWFQGRAFN